MVLVLGCVLLAAGLAAVVLVIHVTAPQVNGWLLIAPLLLAGVGTGMTIAPNQDFVLATAPRQEAGTAAGVLSTAQRIGTALGIGVIGTVLFGAWGGLTRPLAGQPEELAIPIGGPAGQPEEVSPWPRRPGRRPGRRR